MRGFRFSLTILFRLVVLLLFVSNIGRLLADDGQFPSISIAGNQRFSTPEILLALQVDSRLISELAQTTEINVRNEAIARTIQSGYVRCGNLDAKVSGEYSEKNSLYEIRIDEGLAIQKQELEFTGVEPDLINRLRSDLQKPPRNHNEEWIPSLDALSLRVRETGKEDMVGRDAASPGLGGDKYSCPDDFLQIEWIARDAFARNGYSRPSFTIEERIDSSDRKQTLLFRVSELGSQTKIQEVRFSGIQRHDADKLSDALGLRVGQNWTSQEMLRVQRALYESGRFQYHSVYTLPPLLEPSQAIVVVQVIESERLPLFFESLSDGQEKLRRAALDLTEARSGDSVLSEFIPNAREKELSLIQRRITSLTSENEFIFRFGSHLDSISFGYISLSGMPKPDKTGKTTQLSMNGKSQASEGPVFRVSPFATLVVEGEFTTDEDGRSVFKSPQGTMTWKKDGSHVEKLEMIFTDQPKMPNVLLTRLDAVETKECKDVLMNTGVQTSFVIRDTFLKISRLFNGSKGIQCFRTEHNASLQKKLFAARIVEGLLGAESDQYALIRECILDQSRFASEFELKLTRFADSKSLGPISLALAIYFSKDNQHQCIALSQMATKRLDPVYVKAELEEFFDRSVLLREVTQALGSMIAHIPEEVISFAREATPEDPFLSTIEPLFGNPSADLKSLVIEQICESIEDNKEYFGQWLVGFRPTLTLPSASPSASTSAPAPNPAPFSTSAWTVPVQRAASAKPQVGMTLGKESSIKLPR